MTDRRARRDPRDVRDRYDARPHDRYGSREGVYDDRVDDRYGDRYDEGYDDRYEPPDRGRRISPGAVFLVIAVLGSVAFSAYFLTVREATQIPLLAAASVVLAIVFAALALYCLRSVWRGGVEHENGGKLLLVGLVGGVAAIAAAGAAAGAIILFQLALLSG